VFVLLLSVVEVEVPAKIPNQKFAGLPYIPSFPTIPSSLPNRLLGSLKFDTGNSPNSPFSTHFDSDTLSALSDSQDQQHSPGEILSSVSPSCNSPFETNHYLHRSVLSADGIRESLQLYSARSSLLQNANCNQKIRNVLLELESALMAPDDEEVTTSNASMVESSGPTTSEQRNRPWSHDHYGSQFVQSQASYVAGSSQTSEFEHVVKRQKSMVEASSPPGFPGNLKQLLVACAEAMSDGNMNAFDQLISKAKAAVSITGEPLQRLGAYMVEGLVARKEASGTGIYRALKCREPEGKDLLSYMQMLFEICPYLKFGYMAANGAIAEA
ncbi:hypothetical protein PIB30_071739, partial [Stylosanthes scabra]|nr:hypothetical protein [Stylosanthes scabra]